MFHHKISKYSQYVIQAAVASLQTTSSLSRIPRTCNMLLYPYVLWISYLQAISCCRPSLPPTTRPCWASWRARAQTCRPPAACPARWTRSPSSTSTPTARWCSRPTPRCRWRHAVVDKPGDEKKSPRTKMVFLP